MPQNNLRILYDNVVDSSTLTASSTTSGFPVTNLQKEQKGLVWRSTSTTATVTATWSNTQSISCVLLPFCNLTSSATIQVKLYTNAGDSIAVLDTGAVNAGAYTPTDLWGGLSNISSSVNAYNYGGGTYARSWFALTSAKKMEIIISDSTNPAGYLELSRVVCGAYWTPSVNADFGINIGYLDTSEQQRSESGNLITSNGTIHKTMDFNLSSIRETERNNMFSILRGNGLRKPIFVSIFPNETQSLNLLSYPEEFDNAYWVKSSSVISPDIIIAPDETLTADKWIEGTENNYHQMYAFTALTTGVQYTASVYAKAAERIEIIMGVGTTVLGAGQQSYGRFNLQTGVASTYTGSTGSPSAIMIPIGNGWYHCSMTYTSAVTAVGLGHQLDILNSSGNNLYTGNGTSGVYIWGAQLEKSSIATEYIPVSAKTKEQNYQIYGKLNSLNGISNQFYNRYSTSLTIEEI